MGEASEYRCLLIVCLSVILPLDTNSTRRPRKWEVGTVGMHRSPSRRAAARLCSHVRASQPREPRPEEADGHRQWPWGWCFGPQSLISSSKIPDSENPVTTLATDRELFMVCIPNGLSSHTLGCRNMQVFKKGVPPETSLAMPPLLSMCIGF